MNARLVCMVVLGMSACSSQPIARPLLGTGIYVSCEDRDGQVFDLDGMPIHLRKQADMKVVRADVVEVGFAGIWGLRVEVDAPTSDVFEKLVLSNQRDVFYVVDGKVGLGYRKGSIYHSSFVEGIRSGTSDARVFLWSGRDVTSKKGVELVAKLLLAAYGE